MKNWLFKNLFAAEYATKQRLELEVKNNHKRIGVLHGENVHLRSAAAARRDRRHARFKLEGGLTEEEIAERLAGAAETPIIQAVIAVVDRKIVEMSDRATNPPSEANTVDLRTYEAGGANAISELKVRLADLTAPREQEKQPAAAQP